MVRRLVALSGGAAFLMVAVSPAFPGGVELATYRAVYDLVLDKTKQTPSLAELTGRIVLEFTGSGCEGYSVGLRFVTEISDPEGQRRVTDARTKTFESGDGKGFEFTNQTFVDETLAEESEGTASREDGGVSVALSRPEEKSLDIDGSVVFPTEHIGRIIEAARREESFLQIDVYDGAEGGDTVYGTAVVIGKGTDTGDDVGEETAAAEAGFAGLRHWPVTVSYFDSDGEGEQTPTYVMSFILYENGISRKLRIDYGDFAIIGRLSELDLLPAEACPIP